MYQFIINLSRITPWSKVQGSNKQIKRKRRVANEPHGYRIGALSSYRQSEYRWVRRRGPQGQNPKWMANSTKDIFFNNILVEM